ncbi:MAG: glycosyltransferase [Clostridia bacterium]|nr:glycosyltransferase [Clostridia bacterium]
MKTVLHILNTNTYSGAENVAITVIRAMQRLYSDYRLIYVSPDGPIRERLVAEGVEFEPVEKLSRREIKRAVGKYSPDLIHAHDFTASIVSAFSTRVPVISHIHNNCPWLKRLCVKSLAYGVSCFRYRKMLGVSPSVFDEFIFGKFFKKKCEVIGNPIDLAKIRTAAERAEIKSGYDIVFLGRLTEQKNPIRFVEIIGEAAKRIPISAVMIGDGELRADTEKKISELGLSDTIKLTGFVDNPHGILAASRLLVMTSEWEGYGLVAAEALALGKPVVATPVGGIPTILVGREGRLCTDGAEMADAIVSLLTSDEEYTSASRLALKRASEIDNLGEYAEKINQFYSGE